MKTTFFDKLKSKIRLLLKTIAPLNKKLNGILIKVKSLEEIYGDDFLKKIIVNSETIATPELKIFPLFSMSNYLKDDIYKSPEAYVTVLEGVLYCPISNVLLTQDREVISESLLPHHQFLTGGKRAWNGYPYAMNGKSYWRNFRQKKVEHISGCCSVFRGLYKAHFHTMVSDIPRAFLLNQEEFSNSQKIKLLYSDDLNSAEKFFLPKLLPPNVELTPIRSDRLYYIDKLIFPSYLNMQSSGYLPYPYLDEFRSKFLPKRPRVKKNRIFLSRINFQTIGKRHILNEDELFLQLKQLGFERYITEEMSIPDQIELFYDADMVIGAHSSGLTNIIFSEDIKVLELNPVKAIHPYFYLLTKCVGGTHDFWFADKADEPKEAELFVNFTVDVHEILELVSNSLSTPNLGSTGQFR